MKISENLKRVLGIALVVALIVSFAYAAEDQAGQRGQRGQRGGQMGQMGQRGGFDRAAMQERMMEMMKERLGATDEEWTVIEPRLQEVMELSQNTGGRGRGMMGMMGRGRGNRGGQQAAEESTDPIQVAAQELQETLDKEAPTSAEIKAKLAALRGAREKNKQKLVVAQQKLKEVLSVKQEAMLVMMGTLE